MNLKFSPGPSTPPFGYREEGGAAHFSLYSEAAAAVFLGLFYPDRQAPEKEFRLERTGPVWHGQIEPAPRGMAYAFRIETASGGSRWVSDPWAKAPLSRPIWGHRENAPFSPPLALAALPPPFDWEGIAKPNLPRSSLIIYEMHVRGFTKHPSSRSLHPGTYLGMVEKIPYLKQLGVNAVELMPIFEFDELFPERFHPSKKLPLFNYWGYSSLFFFAPMRRFAKDAHLFGPTQEFKGLVKELHRAGIEVILDVVYNHTGETPHHSVHMQDIDKKSYYRCDDKGKAVDYTGCGNTVRSSHPMVHEFILSSLRYWADEMQVDGFRFDLASVLTRGVDGEPLSPSPLIQAISEDPLLSKCKLIAEPWDAAGLYQVGLFPEWGPWSEWNDRFRDISRQFIKGTDGKAGLFASILSGSEFLYQASKTPQSSVNFITAHDGFTLADLVSYNNKHNEENGEKNKDGNSHNESWNCGVEGPTDNPKILALRERQKRNFFLSLFLAQGVPLLLMGDEYGHTRGGNNNPYVQDNEKNWFLWEQRSDMLRFVRGLIALKKSHPALQHTEFLKEEDVDWHGTEPLKPNWSPETRLVAFTLKKSPELFIAFYAGAAPISLKIPQAAHPWKLLVYTENAWDAHWLDRQNEAPVLQETFSLAPHSALLAIQNSGGYTEIT